MNSFLNKLSFTTGQRKIVDCFIFYNELDMLEYRLSALYDIVDYFVICEASVTHVGKSKPFIYLENKDRFARFADKIVHVMMTNDNTRWVYYPNSLDPKEYWTNENTHRNGIARGIAQLEKEGKIGQYKNTHMDDIIVICDLDEIPNPELLHCLKKENMCGLWNDRGANIEMDFFYYKITCISEKKWTLPKVILLGCFCNEFHKSPQLVRNYPFNNTLKRGGWHLSYFGDEHFIKNKIQNFVHYEKNTEEITDLETIREKIKNNIGLYEKTGKEFTYLSVEDNDFPPPMAEVLLEKWK